MIPYSIFFSSWTVNIQIDTTENSQILQLVSFSLVIVRVQAAKKYHALK